MNTLNILVTILLFALFVGAYVAVAGGTASAVNTQNQLSKANPCVLSEPVPFNIIMDAGQYESVVFQSYGCSPGADTTFYLHVVAQSNHANAHTVSLVNPKSSDPLMTYQTTSADVSASPEVMNESAYYIYALQGVSQYSTGNPIQVYPAFGGAITPANSAVSVGHSVTLTAAGSGGTGFSNLYLGWYTSPSCSLSSEIAGTGGNTTYTTPGNLAAGTYHYYVLAVDQGDTTPANACFGTTVTVQSS